MFHLFATFAEFECNLILAHVRANLGTYHENFSKKDINLTKCL